jgi:repressor LexA
LTRLCSGPSAAKRGDGEIVVALLGDEATVKRFYRTEKGVTLKAENPTFAAIDVADSDTDGESPRFRVAVRVMGVLRVMKK